jgi:PKD repeat protein
LARWLLRGGAVVVAATLGLAAVLLPAQDSSALATTFLLRKKTFGPNEEIVILSGQLSEGCDGIIRVSDIYVVPTGTVSPGDNIKKKDPSGTPNLITATLMGRGFAYETIGYTEPAGKIRPGVYDIIEDVCLDEDFNDGDTILRRAFEVTGVDPLNPPSVASELAIKKIKAEAAKEADRYDDTMSSFGWDYFWLLFGKVAPSSSPRQVLEPLFDSLVCVDDLIGDLVADCEDLISQGMDQVPGPPSFRETAEAVGIFHSRVYRGIAADPPDSAYAEPVVLGQAPDLGSGEGTESRRAAQELLHAVWAEGLAAEAFLHALEKYQGAQEARDPAAAVAQAKAASAYARQAAAGLEAQADARQKLLALEPLPNGLLNPTTAAGLAEIHQRLKGGGSLTAAEVAVLEGYGLNEADRQVFVQAVIDEEVLAAPYVSLADLDAQASAAAATLAPALEEVATLFDGIVSQLETAMASASLSGYPAVALSGSAAGEVGSSVTVTASTGSGNTVAWDTDADGDFDDGTGATASAALTHLGPNAVGALATDASGRQTVAYHLVAAAYPASHPTVVSANPAVGTAVEVDQGAVAAFEITPGHTAGLPVTVTWYVGGQAAGTGNRVEVTGSSAKPIQYVEAELTDTNGVTEWVVWEAWTPAAQGAPGLTAGFRSEASTGLVDVAWDRAGGSIAAVSSVYGTSQNSAASNAINSYYAWSWSTGQNQTTNQWITIDLGADWEIAEVRVTPHSSGNYLPDSVELSVGDNPQGPFTPFAGGSFGTGNATRTWAAPHGVNGRYLRLDVPQAQAGASVITLRRIEVLTGQVGGAEVAFADASSGAAAVTGWAWDFGDGTTSTEQNPTHKYASTGTYQVSLTVTDADGGTATATRSQVVRGQSVNPAVAWPAEPDERFAPVFGINRAELSSVEIDWGDGSAPTSADASSWSPAVPLYSPMHTFPDNGVYQVTVTGTDVYGLPIVPVTTALTVANWPPDLWIAQDHEIYATQLWRPAPSVYDVAADGATLVCEWDYGDGATERGLCAESATWQRHMYAPGTYTATVTVIDKDGGQRSESTTVVVKDSHYVNVYPVAGTATADSVVVRVKVWVWETWAEAAGAQVEIAVGSTVVSVTTDAHGVAEARVPRVAWTPVTASVVAVPGMPFAAGSDSNDLSMIGRPQGDVVFLVDDSGSMAGAISSVRENIDFIAGRLGIALDYQIGVMPLNYEGSGPRILSAATDSLPWIRKAVGLLDTNGNGELGPDAIVSAFDSRTGLRPEAASCLVLVADEHTQWSAYTVADATQALADNDATLFSIVPTAASAGNQEYRDMAIGSGGAVFDFTDFVRNPQPVLSALTTQCVASVADRPDLSVTVEDGLNQVAQDGSGTHTVVVSNDGLVGAIGVELTLDVDGPVSLGSVSGSGVVTPLAGGGSRIAWPAFGLAAGQTASFTVGWSPSAGALAGDVVSAAAQVVDDGSNGADLSPANNSTLDTTVVVAPGTQTVSVVYVDDEAAGAPVVPAAGARTVLVGPRLTAVGFTEAEARAGVPSGFVFVSLDNVATFDDDDQAAQVITVHLAHHRTQSSLVATRTVEYLGAGASTPAPVVQDLLWFVATDDVTGVTTYSTPGGYPEVVSPVVPGFHAEPRAVPATAPVASTLARPADSVVSVVYLAGSEQSVSVVYVDDDLGGGQVAPVPGTRTLLVGARLSPVGFTEAEARAGVPEGYMFSAMEGVAAFDDDDSQAQTITVHLAHHHTVSTLVVTRTVEYTGAGNGTPQPVVQEVLWFVDADDVTGVTVYWSSEGYPAVATPQVEGHTPDRDVVAGTGPVGSTTVLPVDVVEVVEYEPAQEPEPTPTPTATPSPTPTPSTPGSTPSPTSSPTPMPSSTPAGPTPTPSSTPAPTPTPTPTSHAAPTQTPTGTPPLAPSPSASAPVAVPSASAPPSLPITGSGGAGGLAAATAFLLALGAALANAARARRHRTLAN